MILSHRSKARSHPHRLLVCGGHQSVNCASRHVIVVIFAQWTSFHVVWFAAAIVASLACRCFVVVGVGVQSC